MSDSIQIHNTSIRIKLLNLPDTDQIANSVMLRNLTFYIFFQI